MRPNLFANTPDILHEYLQHGGRPAFQVRLILAATLGASYGIYSGFELCENVPVKPGSEEYLDSEKYQIRLRDFDDPHEPGRADRRINPIRREHPALQRDRGLRFHPTDNPEHDLLQQALARTAPIWCWWSSTSIRTTCSTASCSCRSATGVWPPDATIEVHDLLRTSATTGAASGTTCGSIPAVARGHILLVQLDIALEPPGSAGRDMHRRSTRSMLGHDTPCPDDCDA